jgi:hypothetical protein
MTRVLSGSSSTALLAHSAVLKSPRTVSYAPGTRTPTPPTTLCVHSGSVPM